MCWFKNQAKAFVEYDIKIALKNKITITKLIYLYKEDE